MIAVAVVLASSLAAAWVIFLSLTALVFSLTFRYIFPATRRNETGQEEVFETPAAKIMRELELAIVKGFEGRDLQAQKKTLETLGKIFAERVKRRFGLGETELTALLANPRDLEETIGEAELFQLLTGMIKPDRDSWDLSRLTRLISKVEDWGR